MVTLEARLLDRLREHEAAGLTRARQARASGGATVAVNGRSLLNFAGNDYLGLAGDPRVIEAFCRGASAFGVGAGAADLISGHTVAHAQLEADLARFAGRSRALLFSTGYMANLSVLSTLASRGATIIQDRLNHASLLDAATLARARVVRYPHAEVDALRTVLASRPASALVVTDGVFSMDGDIAPLPELTRACHDRDAVLVVDDAHGIGVLGEHGAGTVEHFRLGVDEVPVLIGTFGKALGVFGAFVAGSDTIIDTLMQFARPYIYTTALPPAVAVAVSESLRVIATEPQRRARLHARIRYFRQRATARAVPLSASSTAIQPVIIGDAARTFALGAALREDGYLVGVIRPPTVPARTARLRITLSTWHAEEHIDALIEALARLL
ncbi:MAG: 8-amino-7-oxononanoate synthase [Chromatiales bacterium]